MEFKLSAGGAGRKPESDGSDGIEEVFGSGFGDGEGCGGEADCGLTGATGVTGAAGANVGIAGFVRTGFGFGADSVTGVGNPGGVVLKFGIVTDGTGFGAGAGAGVIVGAGSGAASGEGSRGMAGNTGMAGVVAESAGGVGNTDSFGAAGGGAAGGVT